MKACWSQRKSRHLPSYRLGMYPLPNLNHPGQTIHPHPGQGVDNEETGLLRKHGHFPTTTTKYETNTTTIYYYE